MLRKLATVMGYAKAPKATYVLRHPKKGVAAWAAYRGARTHTGRRVTSGLLGVAALGVAVPVAMHLMNR